MPNIGANRISRWVRDRLRLGVAVDALARPGGGPCRTARMPPIGESMLAKVAPNASLMLTVPHLMWRAIARAAGAVLAVDRRVQAVLARRWRGRPRRPRRGTGRARPPGRTSRRRSRSSPASRPRGSSARRSTARGRAAPCRRSAPRAPLATASSTWAVTVSSWSCEISEPMSMPQSRVGAERHRLGPGHEPLDEPVVDLVGDEDPLDRDAELAGVGEARPDGALGGPLDVGVAQHQHRVLAAELERAADQPLRALRGDQPAGRGRAGEADVVGALR